MTVNGMVVGEGTGRGALVRLDRAVAEAVRAPDLYKRFIERGVELKASASPEEFSGHIRAEFDKKGRLAREAGIKPEQRHDAPTQAAGDRGGRRPAHREPAPAARRRALRRQPQRRLRRR